MSRIAVVIGAAVLQLGMISQVQAAGPISGTLHIEGYVSPICHATFNYAPQARSDGSYDLGQTQELCNLSTGYALVAEYQYATGVSGGSSPGTIIVDGQSVALNASGRSTLISSPGPASKSRHLVYVPGDTQISNINISVVATGI